MASTTGIELGRNTCLFTSVRSSTSGGADILALHRIEPFEWPADATTLGNVVRSIRRKKKFPRRAVVVAWDVSDAGVDPAARISLEPFESAGFHIASILSPAQALAKLSIMRLQTAPGEAIAWLALNTHAAAIAIVRDEDVLYSRTFPWVYKPDVQTSKAQLLQRYSLVAHLAPELTHGISAVRDAHGVSVKTIVTCGDLPELRSLTMPLIEELDLEVETLDSTDGLHVVTNGLSERFTELAPAIRLAAAAALNPPAESHSPSALFSFARIAAAAAVLATVAWAAYSYWHVSPARPASPLTLGPRGDTVRQPLLLGESRQANSVAVPSATSAEPSRVPTPAADPPRPVATQGQRDAPRTPRTVTHPNVSSSDSARGPLTLPRQVEQSQGNSADIRSGPMARAASPRPERREPAPLGEPLPKFDTVLIDQDRRLALTDGAVVGVGDSIGSRVVVQIERDAVMLREPSGRVVRVRLRL